MYAMDSKKAVAKALLATMLVLPPATVWASYKTNPLSVRPQTNSENVSPLADAAKPSPSSEVTEEPPSIPEPLPAPTAEPAPIPTPVSPSPAIETKKPVPVPKPTPVPASPAKRSDSTVKIIGKSNEQCVIYVQRMRGDRKAHGYAGNLSPEGQEPSVGSIALERNYGHVSLVVAIDGDFLILHDANWVKGAITERRVHKSTQRGYIY